MRVTSGSHWAELSEEPFGWRAKNRLRDAAAGEGFYDSFALALVIDRTASWSYTADPKDAASWEAVDVAFGDAVLSAALRIWQGAPDPNDSSGKSSPLPQDDPSETPPTSS
jgi:hypothetical protein